MGVGRISGAPDGVGNASWSRNYSNKSAILRFGALVALDIRSTDPLDAVTAFELVGGALVAGPIVGVNTLAPPENVLSTVIGQDPTGARSISVASGVGRGTFILSPNQEVTQLNPFLIPDPSAPGNVMARAVGSGVPPVARAVFYPALSASEQNIEGEFMAGLSAGLEGSPAQLIFGEAVDAVVSARFIPLTGNHVNPAGAANTPVLYRARQATRITAIEAALNTAPGVGNGVRYQFKIGATPAAANAAAAITFADILDANTRAEPSGGGTDPKSFFMAAGDVLVVSTLAQAGGVGAAVHSMISFRAQ